MLCGFYLCMVNLKIRCVTFVYFNYLSHTISGVRIWSNKMLLLIEPCILSPNNFQSECEIWKFFSLIGYKFLWPLCKLFFLIILCLQAIYFCILRPWKQSFSIFPISPFRKIMASQACLYFVKKLYLPCRCVVFLVEFAIAWVSGFSFSRGRRRKQSAKKSLTQGSLL